MTAIKELKKKYTQETAIINGQPFSYRYFKHPSSEHSLVLLPGGMGLSNLMLQHFDAFTKYFSVLDFDYPMGFEDNDSLVAGISQLMKTLGIERANLLGQGYGGMLAQLFSAEYPTQVSGLILFNSGCLFADMNQDARDCLNDIIEKLKQSESMLGMLPFPMMKKTMIMAIKQKAAKSLSEREKELLDEFCSEMDKSLTKEYQIHTGKLMADMAKHMDLLPGDFEGLRDRILLFISPDDQTYSDGVKDALKSFLPEPVITDDFPSGHLALLLVLDEYVNAVRDFIL